MSQSITLKELLVAGLGLLGIGLERLLNAYLIGTHAADLSTRFLIGVLCSTAGSLLLVLVVYMRTRR